MRTSNFGRLAAIVAVPLMLAATPAMAQDEEAAPFTVSGGATVVSDYRFRGFSQSTEDFAIQGTFTASHESGLYVGTWGSSIGFAGGTEIDFYAGYATEVASGVKLDGGVTYYWYPSGTGNTDVIEPYASISGSIGPATAKLGVAYAPDQASLGDESAVYVYTDVSAGIPDTPITIKGHLGYAKSDSFLGGPDGETLDYMVGADLAYSGLTFGISYVNTDVRKALGKEALGADGAVLFSVGASF